jgi:alkylation response protein AidB-like acyl-CoA dehydrogenase
MPEAATNLADKAALEAELVAKAQSLAPVLAERARRSELHRRISDQTDTDFQDTGFYRALHPARYGGMELDYGAQTVFARELGRGCASSGWVTGILACHGWIGGMFPDEAQGEM